MELQHQLAEITGTGKTDGAGADYDTLKENYEQMLQSHEELQKHAEKVDTELDDQKALLRHKLLNPEVLRQEDAELFESNEHKLLLEQLNLFKEAPEEESDQMKHSIAAEVTKKLHSGIADLASRDKVRWLAIFNLSMLTSESVSPSRKRKSSSSDRILKRSNGRLATRHL
ncbi:hypothetical protein BKA80DRAFT_259369 [Phyllosticta citrichinensis]